MDKSARPQKIARFAAAALMAAALVPTGAAFADEPALSDTGSTAIGQAAAAGAGRLSAFMTHPMATSGVDTSWYDAGQDSFILSTNAQLNGLAELVNSGQESFAGKGIVLGSQLMMPSLTAVGTPEHPFEGAFDGAGKTIIAPTITGTLGTTYVGLFGFCGANSAISNVQIQGGTLRLESSDAEIRYIGAVAGYTEGTLSGCSNTMDIELSSTAVPDKDRPGLIRAVGGIAGASKGPINDCSNLGNINISALPTELKDDVDVIAGEIGGIVGIEGDASTAEVAGIISGCVNGGAVSLTTPGYAVGKDRFDSDIFVNSYAVGGIAGYASGNIDACINSGAVLTSKAYDKMTGKVVDEQSGVGCQDCGGIVGAYRFYTFEQFLKTPGDDDPAYAAWKKSNGAERPETIRITNCKNEEAGTVEGVGTVGGIAGEVGAFTQVVGCGNNAQVVGTRWNKPCPAGIAGRSYGDIIACYNNGRIASLTGAGYYAAGICGGLHTYNELSTPDNLQLPQPEVRSCYSTGPIISEVAGYRTGVLVGANGDFDFGGIVHDNAYLPNLTLDKAAIGIDNGSSYANSEVSANDMKSSVAIALINKTLVADAGGWDGVYFVASNGVNKGFPMLSWEGSPAHAGDVTHVSSTLSANAIYAANYDPSPEVTVKASVNGRTVTLVQNADFKVLPQNGARAVAANGYTATIVGAGQYEGCDFGTVDYGIDKADIATCSVVASGAIFNFEQQQPAWVRVYDAAGNEVDPAEYTWSVPMIDMGNRPSGFRESGEARADDPDNGIVRGHFYDYLNCHYEGYRYDVIVSAKDDSTCYYGSTEQQAFRISAASMMDSTEEISDTSEHAEFDYVVWNDQEWKFDKSVLDATDSPIEIKYTGNPIRPTIKNPTYLGHELIDGTSVDYYSANTWKWHYRYIYGNPNAEPNSTNSTDCVDATTDGKLACMTVRYTTEGCNFHNYTNIYFNIVPASVAEDVTVENAESGNPTLTYNGMTLEKGKDYTLETSTADGKQVLTITGIGNYGDTTTIELPVRFADVSESSWYHDVVYEAVGMGLVGGYETTPPTFDPNGKITRGQVATILWRAAGSPSEKPAGFSDVKAGAYYADAVNWAAGSGVVTGYVSGSSKTFRPNADITRQDLTLMLARYVAGEGASGSDAWKALKGSGKVNSYARGAIAWGVDNDVIGSSGDINPQGSATRAEATKMLLVGVKLMKADSEA